MESKFLSSLGLGQIDIGIVLLVISVLLLVAIIVLIVFVVKFSNLKKRYEKFTQGRTARSLEEEIATMFEQNKQIWEQTEKNRRDVKILYKSIEPAFQKIGLVRYDAFNQMGGKLSFSLALLDQKDNGFIINSVHSTDGCYTYSKKIKNGLCDIALGAEEQEALNIATSKGQEKA